MRHVWVLSIFLFAAVLSHGQLSVPHPPAPRSGHPVSACVAKAGGHGRVVQSKAQCDLATESYAQWVVGSALPHIVNVPATSDINANGNALVALLNLANSCQFPTAVQPVVVQLDAGTYALPEAAFLQQWITLQGSGMLSTILEMQDVDLAGSGIVYFFPCLAGSQTLSNMTLLGSSLASGFGGAVGSTLLVDRVQVINANVNQFSALGLLFPSSHYTIMNSIIGPLHITPQGAFEVQADATVSAVIGSEVDFAPNSFSESGLATLICLADYNAAGQPVPQNCNEVAY